jgi:hypothetical protein
MGNQYKNNNPGFQRTNSYKSRTIVNNNSNNQFSDYVQTQNKQHYNNNDIPANNVYPNNVYNNIYIDQNLNNFSNQYSNYNILYSNQPNYHNNSPISPRFPIKYSSFEPKFDHFDKIDSTQSNSTSISGLEESMNNLNFSRPIPKKMNSETNIKGMIGRKKDTSKSLFKEKNEETSFHSGNSSESGSPQLNEILNKKNFDLPSFIKTQKGSRYDLIYKGLCRKS